MNFLDKVILNPPVQLKKGLAYPFIEMANVGSYKREPENVDTKVYSSESRFADGDTVIARITPCLQNGKGFYCHNIGEGFGSTEFIVLRPKDQTIDSRYLYYFMQTNYIRGKMIKSMVGASGRQRVNNDVFASIDISFPEIKIQRRIADILSTYDDLIENNRKQIKLLEEAAQRLYKEWFVDLRFPGHEHTKITDGVPEGWKHGHIADISECFDSKRKPLSSTERDRQQKTFPYYGAASLMDYVERYIYDGIYLLFGEDGTVITADGTPVLQYVWGKFWVNNHAHVFQGIGPYSTEFLYMLCKHMNVNDIVTGVAQPKISRGRLNEKNILIPTEKLVHKYSVIVEKWFCKLRALKTENDMLLEARNRLLPKLMSGEVDV